MVLTSVALVMAKKAYQVVKHVTQCGPQLVGFAVPVLRGRRCKQVDCDPLVDVVVLGEVDGSVLLVQLEMIQIVALTTSGQVFAYP